MNPIEKYISEQPEELQDRLTLLNQIISEALPPETEKKIAYQIPTYYLGRNIIHFSCNKKHIGLYPGSDAVKHFQIELIPYKTSKGTIKFFHHQGLPIELIKEIAKWCVYH